MHRATFVNRPTIEDEYILSQLSSESNSAGVLPIKAVNECNIRGVFHLLQLRFHLAYGAGLLRKQSEAYFPVGRIFLYSEFNILF